MSEDHNNRPLIPNANNLPNVWDVEFTRELRRLVRDEPDPRWEADEESRRVRRYWDAALASDEATGQNDAEIAESYWERMFLDDDNNVLYADVDAWNHPVFQEFTGRYWHGRQALPFLLPNNRDNNNNNNNNGSGTGGPGPDIPDIHITEASGGGSDSDGAGSGDPPPNIGGLTPGPTPGSRRRQRGRGGGRGRGSGSGNHPDPPANTAAMTPSPTPRGERQQDRGTGRGGFRGAGRGRGASNQFMTPPATVRGRDTPLLRGRIIGQSPTRGRSGAPPNDPPRPPPATEGEMPQPLQPDFSDMLQPHTWRGQRQPPVGARLLQILNWVNDEDIDRRRDWARELDEAEDWVREQLDRRDENGLGDNTITLLRQAEAAMQTHRRNERYHYRTFMDLKIPDPNALPKYAPRLPYNVQDPIELGVAGPKSKAAKLLPQLPNIPRPWGAVNNMWRTEREAAVDLTPSLLASRDLHLGALAAAEERLWAPQADQPEQTPQNNPHLLESAAHDFALGDDTRGLQRGWTAWQQMGDEEGEARYLPAQDRRLLNQETDFATERGFRRAGLQAALRQFHSTENHLIANNGRMLVLPGGTKAEAVPDLEEVRRRAGIGRSRPIPLIELPANQMQRIDGKADPQGFTSNMAQFWREARQTTERAHEYALARTFRHSPDGALHPGPEDENKPLPPRSPFGPYVWRGVPARVQLRQDCLRQMRGLKKLFDREKRIAPRQLLDDMEAAYQRGYNLDDDPSDLLRLVENRDRKAGVRIEGGDDPDVEQRPHYLTLVEMEWIRFLLNQSMTEGMAHPALPRTTIYLTFAQRLERIFNDPGDELFPDTMTSVTIEDLIAHMAKMKGPVKKTTFYVYDVKMFLERLAYQGRCRYVEDWRTYGRVQRPLLRYFPEDLILWQPRDGTSADPKNFPEDERPQTPRFEDVQSWDAIIHDEPPETLHEDVRNYFLCLAYRWGYGTRRLEAQEPNWATLQPLPPPMCRQGINRLFNGFELHSGDGVNPDNARRVGPILEDLWRRTLNKADTDKPPEGTTAIKQIQKAVINEVVRADNMLYPGRSTDYRDPLARKTRESVWDWAKPEVRGHRKRFFGLDRWPVQLQNAATQQRIKDDVDVDTDMLWNPIIEDPTPWTYYRPKAVPYGEERVQFKEGHRLFPIGDTARQREVVKNQVMGMVGTAMGILPEEEPANDGVFSRLGRMLGFGTKRPRALLDNPDDDENDGVAPKHKLPRVDPSLIPPSVDVVAEAVATMKAYEEATKLDVIPASQVPEGARDVRFINRAVPNPDNALIVEQNMPL